MRDFWIFDRKSKNDRFSESSFSLDFSSGRLRNMQEIISKTVIRRRSDNSGRHRGSAVYSYRVS